MSDDRRAVIEGIVYGDDPRVTPGERLRALELLADLDRAEVTPSAHIAAELETLDDEQLEEKARALDELFLYLTVSGLLRGDEHSPTDEISEEQWQTMRRDLDAQIQAKAREIRQPEIEARARKLYEERHFRVIESPANRRCSG
jgi:hypothetical protein